MIWLVFMPFPGKRNSFGLFEKAIEAGYTNLDYMKIDPDLDSIRGEVGYLQLLAGFSKDYPDNRSPASGLKEKYFKQKPN